MSLVLVFIKLLQRLYHINSAIWASCVLLKHCCHKVITLACVSPTLIYLYKGRLSRDTFWGTLPTIIHIWLAILPHGLSAERQKDFPWVNIFSHLTCVLHCCVTTCAHQHQQRLLLPPLLFPGVLYLDTAIIYTQPSG